MASTAASQPKPTSTPTAGIAASEVLSDYRVAVVSRHVSLLGRKEVLTGKAKFGIFGDGKEVAQVAMARSFRKGDWRSGYYRDQTFMFAIGELTVRQYFAQLYADPNLEREPASGGRQMNSHFATRYMDQAGGWKRQSELFNVSSDCSPTASQMPRLLGLAYASKIYRGVNQLHSNEQFSRRGDEVAFGTIGDASTSEGIFWETLNAAGVLQAPMVVSVWDDGYGISVPKKYQTTKESISEILKGFHPTALGNGVNIHYVKAWDYPALVQTYQTVVEHARKHHAPALIHVDECTQPQGHSTSGSHERYKNEERLAFEDNMDCLKKMRQWMIAEGLSTAAELDRVEQEAVEEVRREQQAAWNEYVQPSVGDRDQLLTILDELRGTSARAEALDEISSALRAVPTIRRRDVHVAARRAFYATIGEDSTARRQLHDFVRGYQAANERLFTSHLHCESPATPLSVPSSYPTYEGEPSYVQGSQVLQKNFEALFARDARVFAIGEDVGKLGDVNRGMDGIQARFGELRCTDTGIREATILGQGFGAAMRGLRPIVDIQYLDYMLYCFQTLSDDVATLHYRSAGGQAAPVIVRTRGHRLEGVWHTGSPMSVLLGGARGMHICVPRDMTRAAGFYNTLMRGDDPAIVIEVLNGYRLREQEPINYGEFCLPLGIPEVLRNGDDITVVTYGACVRIVEEAAELAAKLGISMEVIDVQTLLPFDVTQTIARSVQRTNAVLFVDEDVPGGASAYMMQQVLERDRAFEHLDSTPKTLAAKPNRSAYGSDGDYYCKPSAEDVLEAVYDILHERDPMRFQAMI
jgi:pyruvate/2-oxoglutarate/acetoin dehydrogenase E1 component/TPP-dependent pyruvate/acetoin dehydrogenase alpha subunit